MKRRNFLQGVAASVGATALPVPALAKMGAVAPKAVPFHYGWACFYARTHNGVAAADIARVFRLSTDQAAGLLDRMVMRGVISPIGADGRCHPTKPWQPYDHRARTGTAKTPRKSHQVQTHDSSLRDRFKAVMAHVTHHPTYGWPA